MPAYLRRIPIKGASTTMTTLAEPSTIVAAAPYPADPTARSVRKLRHRSRSIRLPADARLRHVAGPGPGDPECPVDAVPLRETDPVRVNGYRLVSRLGTGGMADVFYAVAPTGRPVAVKVLRPVDGPQTCHREYRLAHAVDADCTAAALGHGTSTAGAYLVTAYLPGYRRGTTLMGRPTPVGALWTLGSELARMLAGIHAKGIVHCDVKPSNLLVRGHDLRVIDFGIARYVGEPPVDDGTVQCTRGWAAPEQLHAAPATPAIDVFAWGCLLAHLASGVHPFASQSDEEWILRIQSAQPDLIDLPSDLEDLIRWTLARNPRDRPSARELVRICQAGPALSARRSSQRGGLAASPTLGSRGTGQPSETTRMPRFVTR